MEIESAPRYLIIIACSQRKRPGAGLLLAIERYDGVNFRVLRKAIQEGYWPENFDVLILSARYGLIRWDTLIEDYDVKMTRKRALALQSKVSADLDAYLAQTNYKEIFVNLGKDYLIALAKCEKLAGLTERVIYATGGIGKKMSQMKKWLHVISQDNRDHCCQGGSL